MPSSAEPHPKWQPLRWDRPRAVIAVILLGLFGAFVAGFLWLLANGHTSEITGVEGSILGGILALLGREIGGALAAIYNGEHPDKKDARE